MQTAPYIAFFGTAYQNNILKIFFHSPDTNREAIASAGGVVPLLTLSKSYDPRVQQYAVGAIFNLTQSGILNWDSFPLCRTQ